MDLVQNIERRLKGKKKLKYYERKPLKYQDFLTARHTHFYMISSTQVDCDLLDETFNLFIRFY